MIKKIAVLNKNLSELIEEDNESPCRHLWEFQFPDESKQRPELIKLLTPIGSMPNDMYTTITSDLKNQCHGLLCRPLWVGA
ncbi:TPA: hypothetical protein DDW35_03245 [Candidatus Sumerlaeota bacterium]|nr:hypothetical protein [Candidatus Sumerlaeota bacterium]